MYLFYRTNLDETGIEAGIETEIEPEIEPEIEAEIEPENEAEIEAENEAEIESDIEPEIESKDFIYLISIDNEPSFFTTTTEEKVIERMWDIAKKYYIDHFSDNHLDYIRTGNEIRVLSSYKYFIIKYDRVVKRISYCKVYSE